MMKQRMFRFPPNLTLEEAARSFVTVAFVRDPWDRFASAFFEKLRRARWDQGQVHEIGSNT